MSNTKFGKNKIKNFSHKIIPWKTIKRRYIKHDTRKYRKIFNPFLIIILFRELCVLDVISSSIFTVQPQNVVRVHLRIAEENYYNGKRCSNKHPRDRMTIFCSIHLSRFHVTKSPRVGRDEKEHDIYFCCSLSDIHSARGSISWIIYPRTRERSSWLNLGNVAC